ncbi:unnamed protein product [Symbiodinium necroappetens]|uniref:Uncharacterized protein n=1 Tax=Symbiodinium necroappetens TaxID=1628268 RepID=A0A813AJZ3_9DINO|nr:unnamed protein product [Symbiodinium necroappetens]
MCFSFRLGLMQAFQEVCTSLLVPFSSPANSWDDWMQAASHASELAQAARCGHASLAQVRNRLNHWQKPFATNASGSAKTWENVLCECCHAFIEHCAEIVETAGVPPRSASNVLGAAVRLAEVVGKTGLLLAAVDSDLSLMSERVQKLELFYEVLVPRVEAIAGEASVADSRAKKAEEEAAQTKAESERLTRSLRHKCTAAEKRAADLARQVAQLRDRHSLRPGTSSAGPKSLSAGSILQNSASRMRSSESEDSRSSMLFHAADGDAEDLSLEEEREHARAVWHATGPGAGEEESTEIVASSLDPLANFAEAALGHLLSLVKQAHQSHPALPLPWQHAPSRDAVDVGETADAAAAWADCVLAGRDPTLANSVKQSATHLRCMSDLLNSSRSSP